MLSILKTLASRWPRIIVLPIIVMLGFGCTVYRIETAADVPEARLATVEGSRRLAPYFLVGGFGYELKIVRINGESVPFAGLYGLGPYGVEPGKHVTSYQLQYGVFVSLILELSFSSHCGDDLQFEVQEGKQYVIEADTEREPVEVMLKDKQTDTIVTKAICKGNGSNKP